MCGLPSPERSHSRASEGNRREMKRGRHQGRLPLPSQILCPPPKALYLPFQMLPRHLPPAPSAFPGGQCILSPLSWDSGAHFHIVMLVPAPGEASLGGLLSNLQVAGMSVREALSPSLLLFPFPSPPSISPRCLLLPFLFLSFFLPTPSSLPCSSLHLVVSEPGAPR